MIKNKKKSKIVDEHIKQWLYFEFAPLTRDVTCSKLLRDREIWSAIILLNKHSLSCPEPSPTSVLKPNMNTFDEPIKFLHWSFLVVLNSIRSF